MEKKWFYFIQLSNHMWDDGNGKQRYWYDEFDEDHYTPENNVDFEVWDRVVKRVAECGYTHLLIDLGDAIKYKSHPEIAAPDALSVEDFKKLLQKAYDLGLKAIPKLNFSTDHHCWKKQYRRMVSSDIYRQVCVDLINEVCEIFDTPELFHLGLEEEVMEYQGCYPVRTVRSPEKLARDANMLFTACREEGVRPWMWVDPKSIEGYGGKEAFQRVIPKDVLISNWWYGWLIERFPGVHLYREIADWGYEQVPTSSTYENYKNEHHTLTYCKHYLENRGLKGYLTASWLPTMPDYIYGLMHDNYLFGQAKKELYPEEK